MDILIILAVFLGLGGVQAWVLKRFGLRGFSFSRGFSATDAQAGERVEFMEVIGNRSLLFLPWVRVEARMPSSFVFHTKEDVEIRGERYHKSMFTLMPFSRVTRRHRVVPRQRGHFLLTQVSVTAGDLLGMRLDSRDVDAPAELYVYPTLPGEDGLPLPSARPQGDASVWRWILPDPFLVNGIRGYRPGDPVRDIHWPATARTGELQVKTHDYTADPRLMVLINAQKTEDQWGDLMDYEQEPIERAISLAAGLCLRALSQGGEAGFAANIPLDEEETAAYFPPAREAGRQTALLRAFSCLRIRRVCSFPTFLEQLPPLSGVDFVILSCYDSPVIRRHMEAMAQLGNSVALHILPGEASNG